jgi:hypothetical protein
LLAKILKFVLSLKGQVKNLAFRILNVASQALNSFHLSASLSPFPLLDRAANQGTLQVVLTAGRGPDAAFA